MFFSMKKKRVTFSEDCSEPSDSDFIYEYSKHNGLTLWFFLIFLLACLPAFCTYLIRTGTTASGEIEITCLIPALIGKDKWTLSAIRNLTMPPRGRVCTYRDFDYSVFTYMNPEQAFKMANSMKKPAVKKCTIKVGKANYSFRNMTSTFFSTCASFDFKKKSKRYRSICEAASFLILGTLADLFGRKPIIILSTVFLAAGVVVIAMADDYYKLVIGYSMEAFGLKGLIFVNYVLFLELCPNNTRGILMLCVLFTGCIADITGYILKSSLVKYTDRYVLYTLPTLSMLFYAYYMPESPRWYLSYGKKKKAWKILETLGVNISNRTFLPEMKIPKSRILIDNFAILFHVSKYRRTILVLTWVKFIQIVTILNVRRFVKILNLNATSHKFLVFMSEVLGLFVALPPFIIFGRYVCLVSMMVSGTIAMLMMMWIPNDEVWYIVNIMSAMFFYALEYILVLYSTELLPTAARATGVGVIFSAAYTMNFLGSLASPWVFKLVAGILENVFIFIFLVIGIGFVAKMPKMRVAELPDWKRGRNLIET